MDVTSHFSAECQKAIVASRDHAIRLGNNFIGTEHILLGVISGADGPAYRILDKLSDVQVLSERLETAIMDRTRKVPEPPRSHEIPEGSLILTPEAEAVVHEALASSTSEIVGSEHLIATMLKLGNGARRILNEAGVSAESFGRHLAEGGA